MPYSDELARTEDVTLRAQVKVAVAHVSTFVMAGGGNSENNRNWQNHAENAAKNPAAYIDYFIWAVASNATVAAAFPNQTDADVQAVVDAQWPRAWK